MRRLRDTVAVVTGAGRGAGRGIARVLGEEGATVYEHAEEAPVHQAWVTGFAAALRQDDPGAYVNFLGDDSEAGLRAAYPGSTWERLAAVKARYDPTNLFRRNHNIPPATGTE